MVGRRRKKVVRRNNGGPLPRLLTAKQYAGMIGRSEQWVSKTLKDGRIPAAQRVAHMWVIPEDALIVPLYMENFPLDLIDTNVPDEFVLWGAPRKVNPIPEFNYKKLTGNPNPIGKRKNKVRTPGLKSVRERRGYSIDRLSRGSGVRPNYIIDGERGLLIPIKSMLKLAWYLDVDYEELLRDPNPFETKKEED